METGAFYGWGHLAVALAYLAVAYRSWMALRRGAARSGGAAGNGLLLAGAVLVHGVLIAQDVYGAAGLHFGFAQDLSATFLLACALLWIEGFFLPLSAMYVLVTPLAALAAVMPLAFHGAALEDSVALRVHLGVSVLAYGLLMIAALHSMLMASMDRYLHQPLRDTSRALGPFLAQMPPLLALERLLFRLIAIGFVLLTATVASGMVFSEERYGRVLRFNHMTLFAVLSWAVFAALLVGRYAFGWRGRVAQRWVLVGFLMLVLAYIGARFVLEVVLGRVPG
jgi:ABC-type uncharacterized transport system permease subunit